jgi:hypothetical protein
LIRDTIASVEQMGLDDEEKAKLYCNNIINLLRLPLCAV